MNILRMLLVLALCVLPAFVAQAQTTLVVDSAFAPSLNRTARFAVLLPAGYQPSNRYPVLYLLHGLGGSYRDWISSSKLAAHALPYNILIVMPDAGASWYVNAVNTQDDRFEDYITQDLPSTVSSKYSIDSGSAAIAGYSMGGYGAVMLALRHPQLYRLAGSLSGAIIIPNRAEPLRASSSKANIDNFIRVFGDKSGGFYDQHDILLLAMSRATEKTPYLFFAAGIQDDFATFLPAHRELMDSLRVHGMAYEYHELPGKHNWDFWDREVQPLLKRVVEVFEKGKTN
jgi:putative tributyrin esterase